MFSVADADPIKRRLKKLDNFLAAFRSVGQRTGIGFQLTAEARREIKARSRTIEKYLESIEKKSYDLARANKDLYNTKTTVTCKSRLLFRSNIIIFKRSKKLDALPEELQGKCICIK